MLINGVYYFDSVNDVITQFDLRNIKNETKIKFKYEGVWKDTIVGRIRLLDISGIFVDYDLDKLGLNKFVCEINSKYSPEKAIKIIKDFQTLSLECVTNYGFSLSIDDFKKPLKYKEILQDTYHKSLKVSKERRAEIWDNQINSLVDDWVKNNPKTSLHTMMQCGVRVKSSQVRQMVVAKGLLTQMNGDLSSDAVYSSLSDGLSPIDYFRTCGPARRGLANNFFLVPASGYLERQLVNLARDLVITTDDCGTKEGLVFKSKDSIGRYTSSNKLIRKDNLHEFSEYESIRSPATCKHDSGLCKKCCGVNPANGKQWWDNVGIGVIAAQTIVEPATQLSLRGKHCVMGSDTFLDVNGSEIRFKDAKKAVDKGHSIYVHSCSAEGHIEVGKVKKVWQERWDDKYIKITFDNGKSSRCTIDHPFMRRDGTFVEAQNLKIGDSMMPYYTKRDSEGRLWIKHNDTDNYEYGYWISSNHKDCESIYNPLNKTKMDRHHKDFTVRNDYPNNILKCNYSDHLNFHSKQNSYEYSLGMYSNRGLSLVAKHNRTQERRDLSGRVISNWIKNNHEQHMMHVRKGHEVQQKLLKENPEWKSDAIELTRKSKSHLAVLRQIEMNDFNVLFTLGTGHFCVNQVIKEYPELVDTSYPWYSEISNEYFLTKQERQYLSIFDRLYFQLLETRGLITISEFNLLEERLYPGRTRKYVLTQHNLLLKYRNYNELFDECIYTPLTKEYFWTRNNKQAYSRYVKVRDELAKLGYPLTRENYNKVAEFIYPTISSYKYYDSVMKNLPVEENISYEENYNHKVVSIELVELPVKVPFYDLEIDSEWHNYPLSSGVFVHNTSGAVTVKEHNSSVGNALADLLKLFGAVGTTSVKVSDSKMPSPQNIEGELYIEKATNLTNRIHDLYNKNHIKLNRVYIEILVRAMSDIVVNSDGSLNLRSRGYYVEEPEIRGTNSILRNHPSWLKRLEFGYAIKAIEYAIENAVESLDLPCEKLLEGKLR